MEFEKPIADLERQIEELRKMAGDRQLEVHDELAPLEKKLGELRAEIYRNLTPLQRVQVARQATLHVGLPAARLHRLHRAARRSRVSR